jgi:hypothetical protein
MRHPVLVHVVVAVHESGFAVARACAVGVIVLFNFHSWAVIW